MIENKKKCGVENESKLEPRSSSKYSNISEAKTKKVCF